MVCRVWQKKRRKRGRAKREQGACNDGGNDVALVKAQL
jgi:hypothetical protein